MRKQTKFIAITLSAVLVAALGFLLNKEFGRDWSYYSDPSSVSSAGTKANSVPMGKVELMESSEKAELGIPENQSVQVLERDETGMVTAYKPLRTEADAITDDSWKDYASATPAIEASTTGDISQ